MKIVSFASQKGGCGKSTIATMVASHIAYNLDKKVCIIDADTRQKTIVKAREFALSEITINQEGEMPSDPKLCYAFLQQGKKPYDIVAAQLDDTIFNTLEEVVAKDYDVVFIDLPGSIENNVFFEAISNCDEVFIPFLQDPYDFQSNFDFSKALVELVLKNNETRLKNIYRFWNRYKEIRQGQFDDMNDFLNEQVPEIIPLENKVGYSDAVSNSRCRSNILAPAKEFLSYKSFNLKNFLEEVSSIILK